MDKRFGNSKYILLLSLFLTNNFFYLQANECADAIAINCATTSVTGTTTGDTPSGQGTCTTTAGTGGAVWYTFVGDGAAWTFETVATAGQYDTKLWVFSGTCGTLTCVTGDDDGGTGTLSLVNFTATLGITYYVIVGGFGAAEGNYSLNITAAGPCSSECGNASTVTCGTQETGTTTGETASGQGTCTTTAGTGGAVWYTFVGDGETWTFETVATAGQYDTKLWAFSGNCGALTCVTGDDDGGVGTLSLINFAATLGTTYYVIIGGFGAAEGNYALDISSTNCGGGGGPTNGPGGITTNLNVWFKANTDVYSDAGITAATNGGTVQQWDELSGNAALTGVTQTTASKKPIYRANEFSFNPVISTEDEAAPHTMNSPSVTGTNFSASGDITYYSVYSQTSGALCQVWNAQSQTKYGFEGGRVYANGDVSPGNTITLGATTSPSLRSFEQANATGVVNAYENNLFGGTTTNDPLSIGVYHQEYTIGSGVAGAWAATAKIAEIVVYGSIHTAIERNQVSSYLALKHGITLDQTAGQDYVASDGTTEMWDKDAANASIYNNDIFGIGRDDDSELAQIKSKSVNSNAIITLLSEGESTSDDNIPANNNFTDLDNLEFLTIGNNNGTASWTTTDAPLNFEILSREWQVYEQGETGTSQLDFDVSDADFDVPTPILGSNYYLIIDSDNDGSFSDEYATLLSDQGGDIWRSTGLDLDNGTLFTLACTKTAPGGCTAPLNIWLRSNIGTTPSTGTATLTNWVNAGSCNSNITVNGIPDFTDATLHNFNPTIHFNGDNDYLSLVGTDYTSLFVVAELEDLTRVNTHINTWDQVTFSTHANKQLHGGVNGAFASVCQLGYATEFDGAGTWKFDGNDVAADALYTGSHDIISAVGTGDIHTNMLLGGQVDNAPFNGRTRDWQGDVSEYILFATALSAADRSKVESYLAIKYGKTLAINGTSTDYLASDYTVVWDQSANTGYNYDVAGIARDDLSDLDQRKSKSVNDSTVITVEHIGAKATAFSGNKTFFVWGNNGLAFNSDATGNNILTTNPEVIETRVTRIWKSQSTNTVGEVEIEFDMNMNFYIDGGGFPVAIPNDLTELRLLVDADGDFNAGALSISPTSIDIPSNTVKFRHNFASGPGVYFSLGSTNEVLSPLPVKLSHFEGICIDEKIDFNWTTLSEANNAYFTIESSKDGVSFETISTISANRNSNTVQNYKLNNIFPKLGDTYYRLKQTDLNGVYNYYKTIELACNKAPNFKVYPNPFKSNFTIEFSEKSIYPLTIVISNNWGKQLYKKEIVNKAQQVEVQLEKQLPPGSYFVKVYNKTTCTVKQIMRN